MGHPIRTGASPANDLRTLRAGGKHSTRAAPAGIVYVTNQNDSTVSVVGP
jgi:hypothetical protein